MGKFAYDELVRLVLDEKDRVIRMLKQGIKPLPNKPEPPRGENGENNEI